MGALDGVVAVNVDLEAGQVAVTTSGQPDDTLLAQVVDDAGYELTGRASLRPRLPAGPVNGSGTFFFLRPHPTGRGAVMATTVPDAAEVELAMGGMTCA
ncbi:heavy-metal-associated domain-containing protein [Streptomyces chromofuscus]